MKLVIVESPAKGRTLQSFLGKEYSVQSSYGHVRDLPVSKLGVDVEHDFAPQYIIPLKAKKVVSALKKESKKADETILATDEDREGEAIAWHLSQALELKDPRRIVFHEITKPAIIEALKNPRSIDENKVNAQQARRVLDRLVGYKLSPFLWKKVARKLSAGRVQSVAVRLIAEREKEIQKFQAQEYWTIIASLLKIKNQNAKIKNIPFEAELIKKNDITLGKFDIPTEKEAKAIEQDLKGANYAVESVEQKEVKRNPLPPFTTSTLQQSAWQKLNFPARFTMSIAQQLYENGFITYHRTDSLNLSQSSLQAAETFITKTYGKEYHAGFARVFKTKSKLAQEAHEAIRPTDPSRTPESLKHPAFKSAHAKLYTLIWQRFIASQMASALFDATTADISAKNYMFRATGQVLKFPGFLKVYSLKFQEAQLPALEKGEELDLQKLLPLQHFTEPPPRYTEATLVKALEEHGIGRPSTYAPIISTIQDRGYVEKDEQRKFKPTELGVIVNDLLVEHFPKIVDIEFTADMETKLDDIANGEKQWTPMISEFYQPFAENLEKKYLEVKKKTLVEETDKKCPNCGSPLVIRFGKFGKFYACSKFPECKYTESLKERVSLNMPCPKCKEGEIIVKRTKKGRTFYGCSKYPECDYASWQKPKNEVK